MVHDLGENKCKVFISLLFPHMDVQMYGGALMECTVPGSVVYLQHTTRFVWLCES